MIVLVIGRKKLYGKIVGKLGSGVIFEGRKPFSPFVSTYVVPQEKISYLGLEG